jgi:type II secretory pathway pseudopilin PulG
MYVRRSTKTGFTIIEVSLAMIFVSFLLIAVVVLTIRMSNIYAKGNTIKSVTAVGRSIISDFKKVVSSSPAPADLDQSKDPHITFLIQEKKEVSGVNRELSGRFCTGTYSYLWNTGYQIKRHEKDPATAGNVITYDSKPVRLLKISDSGRRYCDSDKGRFALKPADDPGGAELISSSESNLALYQFGAGVTVDDSAGGQALYAISFVLGTMSNTATGDDDGSIAGNMTCTPPGDGAKSEFNYCAINKFDILVKATGNKSS